MASESRKAVVAAIIGNLAIAVSKFVAAGFSGSAAMLSEAIHSLVDTGNGALMLVGIYRSKKPADADHPFGSGHELYFWTLMVGVLIFGLGGGMSILTGVLHIRSGQTVEDLAWNYGVLGIAAVFEAVTWGFGWRAFSTERRGRGIVETILDTKDPTSFSVLLEDTAALTGLAVAFAGIFVGHTFGITWLDGAASIVIGILLCLVAIVMVNKSRTLLVGEGVSKATLEGIRALTLSDSCVAAVGRLRTMYFGPDEVMLVMEMHLHDDTDVVQMREATGRIKKAIREKYPKIKRVFFDINAELGA
jgi:cation diffusion facilitator family transporter